MSQVRTKSVRGVAFAALWSYSDSASGSAVKRGQTSSPRQFEGGIVHLDGDISGDTNFSPHLCGTIAYPHPDYPFIAQLNTQHLSIDTIHRLFTQDLASEFCKVCHDYGGAEGELAGIKGIDVLIAELFSQDVHTAVGQHRDEIEIFGPDNRRQVKDVITVAI